MVNLNDVVRKFNKEIVSWRVDCYAFVEDGGFIVTVRLDGASVVKMDANGRLNVLLKPGFKAYEVLQGCFPDDKEAGA